MAASQQFCVKWNSYSTNLQSVFPRLLTSEHFVDVTLACEGQMIKCHKVVLSACSTYFERLLVANPCPHPIIFMKDMKHFEVQALVDFMYRGEVNVSQDELNSLLIAAEALQIRGLCGSENMSAVNGRPRSGSQQGHMNTPTSPRAVSSSNETDVPCQPTKRRRSDSDVKPKIVSVTSNGEEVGVAAAYNNSERTSSGEETPGRRHSIKQESLEMDEHGANYPDADGNDEDYDRVDHEDSDGVQQESHTDQAGPSGVGYPSSRSGNTTPDKTATEMTAICLFRNETIRWPMPTIGRKIRKTYDAGDTSFVPKVEISPNSGVCVSEDVWRRINLVSSPTQVVRRLLLALFSAETLMRSNLRGGKCKNKRLDTGRRDKLDERVTDAIYDATVQRFPGFTKGAFGVAVNSKIAELRFHNSKK